MRTAPIRTRRHDVSQRPFIVISEMAQACPLACEHCRAEARPGRHPGELTADEARDLMAPVAEFGSPPPIFVLTGGDGACEFAPICGGSRSRAFALTGDPYAEDPWCSYRPGTFPYPDDLAAAGPRLATRSR